MEIRTPEDIDSLELSRNPFKRHRQVIDASNEILPYTESVGWGTPFIGMIGGRGYLHSLYESRQQAESIVATLDATEQRTIEGEE